jgi:hypothetical protein
MIELYTIQKSDHFQQTPRIHHCPLAELVGPGGRGEHPARDLQVRVSGIDDGVGSPRLSRPAEHLQF